MRCCTVRRLLTLAAVALLTATLALAQSTPSAPGKSPDVWSLADHFHYDQAKFTNWNSLAQINPGGKLLVVTLAQPTHRHSCAVRSFTAEELLCKGPFGSVRSYKAQDIAALVAPGGFAARVGFGVGFTGATAVVAWRAFALAATCIACAVGSGIAAFVLFYFDLGIQAFDFDYDSLLYLAPGQTLQVKLRA